MRRTFFYSSVLVPPYGKVHLSLFIWLGEWKRLLLLVNFKYMKLSSCEKVRRPISRKWRAINYSEKCGKRV